MPIVSVLMPVHNEENVVGRAIDSVMEQTLGDWELIIINDGSSDSTEEKIRAYDDDRICLVNKSPTGVADSLNVGLRLAAGRYIARLDADDECAQDRLGRQLGFMEKHDEIALVGSWAYLLRSGSAERIECKVPLTSDNIRRYMQKDNPFIHSTIFMRREVPARIGMYPCVFMEDYAYFMRVARVYTTANIPEFLVTRYEGSEHHQKKYYNGVSRSKIYAERLRYQLRAVRLFGWEARTPISLGRTVVSLMACKLPGVHHVRRRRYRRR